ncbi:hypothetical protein ACOMHN_047972 [Nucella lapillus]
MIIMAMFQVTSTIFILALAWADTFTCSVIIPLTIIFNARDTDLGFAFLCRLYQFLITFNVPLAAFIMVAIAVDRYFSICHPFLHAVTPRRARFTVIFLCTFTFLLGTIPAIGVGYNYYPPSTQGQNKSSGEDSESTTAVETSTVSALSTEGVEVHAESGGGGGGGVGGGEGGGGGGFWLCQPPGEYLSMEFMKTYQKFYASLFLLAVIAVFIIYALIYRSVVRRREWRRRQRSNRPPSKSPVTVTVAAEAEEMELSTRNGTTTAANGGNNGGSSTVSTANKNGCNETQLLNSTDKKASKERRDFNFLANIRTAAMLFVVTLVFIVSFLPAWLMAVEVVNFHEVVFYLYFIYNVANPVIYAFMNHAFRKELKRVFQRGLNLCGV